MKPALPPKDQPKVSAVATMSECWSRLGKIYGDEILNLITVKSNLKNFQPKSSSSWERVLEIYDEVDKGVDQLRVIGALVSVKEDYELVSSIINKLSEDQQQEWDRYNVDNRNDSRSLWDKFTAFLSQRNDMAIQSKLRHMSSKVNCQSRTASTTPEAMSSSCLRELRRQAPGVY